MVKTFFDTQKRLVSQASEGPRPSAPLTSYSRAARSTTKGMTLEPATPRAQVLLSRTIELDSRAVPDPSKFAGIAYKIRAPRSSAAPCSACVPLALPSSPA